jgi:Domain of unknown function (DUF222)
MDRAGVVELVDRIIAVPADCADRDLLVAMVADVARLKSWCESIEIRGARLLATVSSFPEKALADGSRSTLRAADRIVQRATVAEQVPALGAALAEGSVSGEHVDVVGSVLRDLTPDQRALLVEHTTTLVAWAAAMPVDAFRRKVQALVRSLDATAGEERLARQQRATRLRTWIDQASGMGRMAGEFDPVTYLTLHRRIEDMVASLFTATVPDTCPTDPCSKQDHLRALALLALIEGKGGRVGKPEFVVVVDATAPDDTGAPTIDWGLPVEIPHRVLRELFDAADVHTVVIRSGVVLHAPGQLNLGRSTRHPNQEQRRALRALYATCGIPGCRVAFDHCDLHHIKWWTRDNGPTDLANLVPLCSKHHHAVHDDGWHLTITDDRQLTIRFPDGTQMTTGPPKRNAA